MVTCYTFQFLNWKPAQKWKISVLSALFLHSMDEHCNERKCIKFFWKENTCTAEIVEMLSENTEEGCPGMGNKFQTQTQEINNWTLGVSRRVNNNNKMWTMDSTMEWDETERDFNYPSCTRSPLRSLKTCRFLSKDLGPSAFVAAGFFPAWQSRPLRAWKACQASAFSAFWEAVLFAAACAVRRGFFSAFSQPYCLA